MSLTRRVAELAARAGAAGGECPGRGVVTTFRDAADPGPDPPPCPGCGGRHDLLVREVVVTPTTPGERAES